MRVMPIEDSPTDCWKRTFGPVGPIIDNDAFDKYYEGEPIYRDDTTENVFYYIKVFMYTPEDVERHVYFDHYEYPPPVSKFITEEFDKWFKSPDAGKRPVLTYFIKIDSTMTNGDIDRDIYNAKDRMMEKEIANFMMTELAKYIDKYGRLPAYET